jgi:hypothetical protein
MIGSTKTTLRKQSRTPADRAVVMDDGGPPAPARTTVVTRERG